MFYSATILLQTNKLQLLDYKPKLTLFFTVGVYIRFLIDHVTINLNGDWIIVPDACKEEKGIEATKS